MKISSDLIFQLIDHLYAAPTSANAWEAFLAQLNQLCGSDQVYLRLPADAQIHPVAQQPSADQHLLQTVFTNGPVSPGRYLAAGPRGPLLPHATGLALARAQARGPFPEEAIQLLAAIRPHLARAVEQQLDRQRAAQQDVLSRRPAVSPLGWFPALFDIPVIALDRCCAVAEVSPAARLVLEQGGLRVAGATLTTDDAEEEILLRQLLAQAGPLTRSQVAADPQFGGTALFSRANSLPPLRVVLMRLGAPATADGPTALLFLQSPAQRPFPRSAQLRSLYCLNPTELRLVDQLASGRKVKEAASALRLTENTTRFHLKEVFRKMEVNSQTELLRTVLSIPGYIDSTRSIAV
ncbi:regulatory protein, luxR family [Granulicella rosea]|uniref:Regulatory protein, luxR family n=1 Tax=Granulicella rosea TaxID=474952 RepID=A0A239LXN9_9BACT|nr:helix-turn-helix transcriptional regulator [Granulicella rosea]SNT35040.1 regulatory protein, luxR family [Granulicella rosea]